MRQQSPWGPGRTGGSSGIKGLEGGEGSEDSSRDQAGPGAPPWCTAKPWQPSLPPFMETSGPELPLLAPPGPSPQVPVIRNGGSNTLNFQFHDPAPRTVCNGHFPPRRDTSRHPGGSVQENLVQEPQGGGVLPAQLTALPGQARGWPEGVKARDS